MKKIVSLLLLWILCISLIPQTNALYSYTLEDELTEYDGGVKFINRIDTILPKVESTTLLQLESKLKSMKMPEDMERETELKLKVLTQKLSEVLQTKALNQDLTDGEVKKVESDILKMQQNILSDIETSLWKLISEITTSIWTREQGSLSWTLYYNIPYFGKLNVEVSLSEYTADTENLEKMRLKWDIKFWFDMWEETLKSTMSFDLIIDKNDIYILVKNIQLTWSQDIITWSKEIVEFINTLWDTETYIHIGSDDTGVYSDLDIEAVFEVTDLKNQEWYKILNTQALMTPTWKIGNSYFLSANEEMCHFAKIVTAVFDPFSGKTCSEKQLKKFQEDIAEALDIRYISKGNKSEIELNIRDKDAKVWSGIKVSMISWKLNSLIWDIEDTLETFSFNGKYQNGQISFDFLSFDFSIIHIFWEIWFQENILSHMNIDFEYDERLLSSQGNITLKDTVLTGKLIWKEKWKEILNCNLTGIIKKDIFQAEWKCDFDSNWDSWKIQGNLDIDTRNNTNNIFLELLVDINDEILFNVNLQNTSTRQSLKNMNISKPWKTIELEEFMKKTSSIEM